MKVLKFRIKNYKSIIDSGDCYFSEKLTVLAGKNESGKTSILEALEDFHEDKEIRDSAKPLIGDGNPEISITFEIDKEQINNILEKIEAPQITENVTAVTLFKKYKVASYNLGNDTRSVLGMPIIYTQQKELVVLLMSEISKALKEQGVEIPELKEKRLDAFKTEIDALQTSINASSFENKDYVIEKISKVLEAIDLHYEQEAKAEKFSENFVKDHLPYFILFSSFEDVFPESVDLATLSNNEWAQDLQEVSSFEIKKITSTNEQEQENHERSVNVDFSDKFKEFWTQDDIKLEIKKDGEKLKFRIIENDVSYKPEQRSKGQQWYLGFYIKIVSKINDSKPNILLIDEPGLYLHAKAQKDLLKVLKDHSSNYPVVFSTHSPYLIESNDLESVRLVEKKDNNKEGSRILGKIHAHTTANKETMTPILTAIGLGVNDSILNLEQKNNIVVEGPADVFYLQAFKILYPDTTNINFINGGGAPNMGMVGAILEGWGANVLYLFDNDSGKTQGMKKLDSWKVLPDQIKEVLSSDDTAIEDIFSSDDFKKHVLENEKLTFKIKNSDYMKNKDKVLTARKFLQNTKGKKITLDTVTKKNITSLLSQLNFAHDEE